MDAWGGGIDLFSGVYGEVFQLDEGFPVCSLGAMAGANQRLKKLMDNTKITKRESFLCQTFNAILLAGIIILFIGVYYWVIKAGIPYQDPPLELQIQYAVNMGIGDLLVKDGFLISMCGGIARLLYKLAARKKQK